MPVDANAVDSLHSSSPRLTKSCYWQLRLLQKKPQNRAVVAVVPRLTKALGETHMKEELANEQWSELPMTPLILLLALAAVDLRLPPLRRSIMFSSLGKEKGETRLLLMIFLLPPPRTSLGGGMAPTWEEGGKGRRKRKKEEEGFTF